MSTDEAATKYNAGAIHAAEQELLGPVERERLAKSPQWMRLVVNELIRRIVNLRAALAAAQAATPTVVDTDLVSSLRSEARHAEHCDWLTHATLLDRAADALAEAQAADIAKLLCCPLGCQQPNQPARCESAYSQHLVKARLVITRLSPPSASAPAGAPSEVSVTVLTPADVEAFKKACDATEPTVELRRLMALLRGSRDERS